MDTDQRYLQADAGENRDDGCTAVTAVLVGQKLIVAHVGDSRAVLYRSGQGARPRAMPRSRSMARSLRAVSFPSVAHPMAHQRVGGSPAVWRAWAPVAADLRTPARLLARQGGWHAPACALCGTTCELLSCSCSACARRREQRRAPRLSLQPRGPGRGRARARAGHCTRRGVPGPAEGGQALAGFPHAGAAARLFTWQPGRAPEGSAGGPDSRARRAQPWRCLMTTSPTGRTSAAA